MQFNQSTPSPHFTLQDQHSISTHNYEDIQLDHTLFDLSNTNNKNTQSPHNLTYVSLLNINKQQTLQTTPTVLRIDTQDFFQQFSSKFTVKFQESQNTAIRQKFNSLRQHIENEQAQQMSIQKSIQQFKDVRLSFPTDKYKQNYFGISINNQKGLKSEIISFKKKGCFGVQNIKINQIKEISQYQINSAAIKHKKGQVYLLPQVYQPKSCRNISGNLYFTSKATPMDAKYAKKALQKHKLQLNTNKRQKSMNLPQIMNNKIKTQNIISTSRSRQFNLLKKDSIFIKLPNIK